MLFEEDNKEKLIEKLNKNFRTILSYGNDGLLPSGEFIVKDIKQDVIPEEYASRKSDFEFTNIILTKIDDENVQIVLPMTIFLTKYAALSEINADKLGLGSDLTKTLERVEVDAKRKIMSDDTLKDLLEAETMSLEESEADYLIDGEVQSSNYSICPINLGIYREKIRDSIEGKDEKSVDTNESIIGR